MAFVEKFYSICHSIWKLKLVISLLFCSLSPSLFLGSYSLFSSFFLSCSVSILPRSILMTHLLSIFLSSHPSFPSILASIITTIMYYSKLSVCLLLLWQHCCSMFIVHHFSTIHPPPFLPHPPPPSFPTPLLHFRNPHIANIFPPPSLAASLLSCITLSSFLSAVCYYCDNIACIVIIVQHLHSNSSSGHKPHSLPLPPH